MAAGEHYCTYFDHHFLDRGLLLISSLHRHARDFTLHILCLSDDCHRLLTGFAFANVRLWRLAELEAYFPELAATKVNRGRIEYFFTLTPFLPRFLFDAVPTAQRLTYVDADLWFHADPAPAFAAIGDTPIAITAHNFSAGFAVDAKYGRFNVGWLTFRRDPRADACLRDWSGRTADWCYDRLEGDRFADQKYLDAWPKDHPSTRVIAHKGVNAAIWNMDNYVFAQSPSGTVTFDGEPLICFHYHGITTSPEGQWDIGIKGRRLDRYGDPSHPLYFAIFAPYLEALAQARAALAPHLGPDAFRPQRKPPAGDTALLTRCPDGWPDLGTDIPGWDQDSHARKRAEAVRDLRRKLAGPGPWADGAAHVNFMNFAAVLGLVAGGSRTLSVLDWGGGLGEYFFLARKLRPDLDLDWTVAELPTLLKYAPTDAPGLQITANQLANIPDASFNLTVASGTLQYLQDWRTKLSALSLKAQFLYLTRTPISDRPTFAVVEQAPAYQTSYPAWVLNQDDLLRAAASCGLEPIAFFPPNERRQIADEATQAMLVGMLFRKVAP